MRTLNSTSLRGLPYPHVRASDRMSRSELALFLLSYPTASQVMMSNSKEAIVETKTIVTINLLCVCCKRAGWAACVANDMGHCQWVVMRVLFCFLSQWCLWLQRPSIHR